MENLGHLSLPPTALGRQDDEEAASEVRNTCEKMEFSLLLERNKLWPERQLSFDVRFTNKGLEQSSLEFSRAHSSRTRPSLVQIVCIEEETEHGLHSIKNSRNTQ
ncbi:hypothetical protein TNCV_4857881 [Trichonephila clavipes]|nr:hypothetical protein TNCV_4857881 [Trichonephila clavipes]